MDRQRCDQRFPQFDVHQRGFSEAFRVVCRAYFDYKALLEKEGASERQCPIECPEREPAFDIHRKDHCDNCDKRRLWRGFKDDTEELWAERLGEEHGYVFEEMVQTVYAAIGSEYLPPERRSPKTSVLISICSAERKKMSAAG